MLEAGGGAAEDVFDGYVADLGGESVAFDDFGETGNGFARDSGVVAMLEDDGHLRAGGGRQCDENGFDAVRRDDRGQRGAGAQNFRTVK